MALRDLRLVSAVRCGIMERCSDRRDEATLRTGFKVKLWSGIHSESMKQKSVQSSSMAFRAA